MSIICHRKQSEAQNVVIHGGLLGGQLCTHPPILPDVAADDPIVTFATCKTSLTQKTLHSLMFASMPSTQRLLSSKLQNIKSSTTHCKPCLTSSKALTFADSNSSSTNPRPSMLFELGLKSSCGEHQRLVTPVMNAHMMHTSTSLVSQSLIVKPQH